MKEWYLGGGEGVLFREASSVQECHHRESAPNTHTVPPGVAMKVPQLLQHFEHLVSPLAQALHCWTQEFGTNNVVSEVVRSVCTHTHHPSISCIHSVKTS